MCGWKGILGHELGPSRVSPNQCSRALIGSNQHWRVKWLTILPRIDADIHLIPVFKVHIFTMEICSFYTDQLHCKTQVKWTSLFTTDKHNWLVCDLNHTPNCYGKTWRFLCPFFRNLHLRENLARDCFTSTVSTVTNSVQNIFTHLRYCDK